MGDYVARPAEQVQRILDEHPESRLDVIVRIDDKAADALADAIADGVRERTLRNSARDLLPPSRHRWIDASAARPQAPRGMAERIAACGVPSVSRAQLRRQALDALQPLLAEDTVRRSIAREGAAAVRAFWTARSVLLELGRDDLARLPTAVPTVADVYPNRSIRVPPLVEVTQLPPELAEPKAASWGVTQIGALSAWGAYGGRGGGTTIGLLDTGVDADHPDLAGKVSAWAEFGPLGDEVTGSQPHDTDRHGTHVAGTLVGGNSGGSWTGVAPDADVAVALVLDGRTGGTDAQVLAGIDWAVEQGVDVINMSLGGLTLGPETPSLYTQAILTALRAGIPVVAAIGNAGRGTSGSPGNDLFALAVGATDYRDVVAAFSGGRTHVVTDSDFVDDDLLPLAYFKPEVSAPGVAIRSCVPGGEWASFNGTSMATPHAAGAVALLLSTTGIRERVGPTERAYLVQDLLTGSAREFGEAGEDHRYGFGRIDVLAAVAAAREQGY